MSRFTALRPFLATGLLLAACSDAHLTDVELPGDPQASSARAMVPVTWTYHVAPVPGTEPISCTNSDGSPPFLTISTDYITEGIVTHLGRLEAQASTARFSACTVTMVGGYAVSGEGGLTGQLVGANGDAIYISGVLTLSFANGSATGAWTITGGTGRFTGASGWFETVEVPSPDGTGSVGSGTGMITPPGSLAH